MTSNRAAGYSSKPKGRFIGGLDAGGKSSPLGQASGGGSLLAKKQQESAEEVRACAGAVRWQRQQLLYLQVLMHCHSHACRWHGGWR